MLTEHQSVLIGWLHGSGRGFMELVGCRLPLQLASLGGPVGTPGLAAAVSEAGGLGMIPNPSSAAEVTERIESARALTTQPIGVGILVPFLATQALQAAAWGSGLEQARVASASIDDRRFVFIAMPFGAAWSDALHACIESACASANADGLALRWQRADEIERPGRITEQIHDALAAADVVIADITGLNANVVYELGYAEATHTPLTILSQDPAASPFDLKDLRQILYSPDDLDAVRHRLTAYLRAALRTDDDRS